MSLAGRAVIRERERRAREQRRRAAKAARPEKDHSRVTPEGRVIGEQLARICGHGIALIVSKGLADERCASCAFRPGTVPNGCPQTGMDALKAVLEGVPFLCHQVRKGEPRPYCFGWLASRVALAKAGAPRSMPVSWDFSPDEPEDGSTS